jgi:hypothetical protein
MEWSDAAEAYYRLTLPHDGRLSSLPSDWQRELVALLLLDQEVNNGGYLQFLANCGREASEYAVRALRAIAAARTAALVEECQTLVDRHTPTRGRLAGWLGWLLPNAVIGRDGRQLKAPGSALPARVLERIYELSYEYMGYQDDIGSLAQAHYGPLLDSAQSD